MRIIAGEHRGRRLFAPEGDETRPTSDKVREALFNIIRDDVFEAQVLDLFAGSGALALEALSRGARSAVLCDKSKKAASAIRRNIDLMRCGDRVRLVCGDWHSALAGSFTLVFLDPPYRMNEVYVQAAEALISGGHLAPGALVVMEHASDVTIDGLPEPLVVTDVRRYRDTSLTFVRLGDGKGGEAL